jgi:glutathione S-transferase
VKLIAASLAYSSWSIRAWLTLKQAGAEFEMVTIGLKVADGWKDQIRDYCRAGTVPILIDGDLVIHESLAICEYLNERFPDARLWPENVEQRARARAISAEMSAGFHTLRDEMPMNYRGRANGFLVSEAAQVDVDRICGIWQDCRSRAERGPYLFGDFSIADAMYLPVVCRFQTYGVELAGAAADYAAALWEHPVVREWTRIAETAPEIPVYDAALAAASKKG